MTSKINRLTRSLLLGLNLIIFSLSACSPAENTSSTLVESGSNQPEWSRQHLRAIDAVDMKLPVEDIIAVYSKESPKEFIIRVDFLEFNDTNPNNLVVALDYTTGGTSNIADNLKSHIFWDALFKVSTGELTFFNNGDPRIEKPEEPYTTFNQDLDTVFITFPKTLIGSSALSRLKVQVFYQGVEPSGSTWDHTGSFTFDAPPPKQLAPLLLVFWNCFNAGTPAQALRSWNGAHTGVIGQRHGLFHLLAAVKAHHIPVVVLDIKKPPTLAALSFMGQIDQMRSLEEDGLLILPDAAYGDPDSIATSLNYSQKSVSLHNLKSSAFVFGAFDSVHFPVDYKAGFAFLNGYQHIYSVSKKKIIPLPMPYYLSSDETASQLQYAFLDENGLTNFAKTQLIQSALSEDSSQINVFGGDLKNGLWGAQYISDEVFDYIAAHPWIMPMTEEDLLSWKTKATGSINSANCADILCSPQYPDLSSSVNPHTSDTVSHTYLELKETIRESLNSLSSNPVTDSAWEMFLMLTTPTSSLDHQLFQVNHLSSVGHLIEASRWYDSSPASTPATRCQDIDWDGESECVLYNDNFFAAFEQDGGLIHSAFIRTPGGVSQLFGTSFQFFANTGPQQGSLSSENFQPEYFPGSVFDEQDYAAPYKVTELADGLLFTSQNTQKTYRLTEQQLSIQASSNSQQTIFLTFPNKNNLGEYSPQSNLTITNHASPDSCEVMINSNGSDLALMVVEGCAAPALSSYTDSLPYLSYPEDPNQIFPEGHYLPFPISILKLQGGEQLNLTVHFLRSIK